MNTLYRSFISLIFWVPSMLLADSTFNQWHDNGMGVLSVIAQTEKNEPVFVSIAVGGTRGANIVVTLQGPLCDKQETSALLWVNNIQEIVGYHCEQVGDLYLMSYSIVDSDKANAVYTALKSGFTVVLDKRIKIWVANINTPEIDF